MKRRPFQAQLCACAALFALAASGAAVAQSEVALSQQRAGIVADQGALTAATRGSPQASVDAALRSRGKSSATIDSIVLESDYPGNRGVRHAQFEQRINGLRVYGAYVKASFNADGELIHLIERTAPAGGRIAAPTLGDAEALQIALDANFSNAPAAPRLLRKDGALSTFAKTDFFHTPPSVERVIVSRGQGRLEEGFLVETWSEDDNLLFHTVIDGLGKVVSNELRTAEDSYNIFEDHPGVSSQTVVNGPGAGNAQSPAGWLFGGTQGSIDIAGNNVNAYLDRDNNDSSDGNGTAISDGNFLAQADLTRDPTITVNQDVAIQNLFYLNNVIHDRLYIHGFVEGAGNFQEDNFGNGGSGSDSVNAEGQDGGSTNNANFATPSDGSNPRMQMYLWTQSTPNRDGDLDSDIVWHEYGHGLTWRMIGSMSGDVPGAIGEGMSDTLSIIINDNDRLAEYSFNNPGGIRSSPYSQHQDTIGDFSASRGVHRNGEIYAATAWDLWTLYKANAFTANDIFDDLVGGMNFTPSSPTYIDMRDGVLAQVQATAPSRECLVWEAFAGRGMGDGASMTVTQRGPFNSSVEITESFALPSSCTGGGGNNPPTADFTVIGGQCIVNQPCSFDGTSSSDPDGDALTYAWDFGDGGMSTGATPSHTYGSTGSFDVTLTVDDGNGGSDSVVQSVSVVDEQDPGDFTLAATGEKIRGVHNIHLSWNGAASTNVDVYRNGAVIATTVNDGAFTDNTGNRGGATYTHQVCEAGTTTCSNMTTTTF